MVSIILAVQLANAVRGGLSDTGQSAPKKAWRVSPKIAGSTSLFDSLFKHICWKVRSGKRIVFCKLSQSVSFSHFLDALASHFEKVFAQILIAVWRMWHLRHHCFTVGLAQFLPLQLILEASKGRKTRRQKQCQFQKAEKQVRKRFWTVFGVQG